MSRNFKEDCFSTLISAYYVSYQFSFITDQIPLSLRNQFTQSPKKVSSVLVELILIILYENILPFSRIAIRSLKLDNPFSRIEMCNSRERLATPENGLSNSRERIAIRENELSNSRKRIAIRENELSSSRERITNLWERITYP